MSQPAQVTDPRGWDEMLAMTSDAVDRIGELRDWIRGLGEPDSDRVAAENDLDAERERERQTRTDYETDLDLDGDYDPNPELE